MQRISPCIIVLLSLLNTASFGADKSSKPLEIISITPSSPAKFKIGEKCVVKFRYNLPGDGVYLAFVRPFTNGKPTKNTASSGSHDYSSSVRARDTSQGSFEILGDGAVDEVRITMVTKDDRKELFRVSQKVNLKWGTGKIPPRNDRSAANKSEKVLKDGPYTGTLKSTGDISSEFGVGWHRPGKVMRHGTAAPRRGLTLPKYRYDGQEFVSFKFGNAVNRTFWGVIDYDTEDDSESFAFDLYLDRDRDRDMAEDKATDGKVVWLKVPYREGKDEDYGFRIYSVQRNGKKSFRCRVISGRTGKVKAGDVDINLLVIDNNCNGMFNDTDDALLLDRNLDGRIENKHDQRISLYEEFSLPWATYKIVEIDPAGRNVSLELVRLTPETAKKPAANSTTSNKVKSGRQEKGRFAVGRTSPRIRYKGIDNKPVMIDKMKGKVILIDFWPTWCGPCTAEMPTVISAYEQLHDSGFEIIGISLDKNRDTMVKYINDNNMPWPQFYDGKGWNNRLAKILGIKSIPATILVDKKGVVRYIDLRGERMIEAAKQLLAE